MKNGQWDVCTGRCSPAKESVYGSSPNLVDQKWRSGLNRISHPDWVKLSVELNCAPNQNTKFFLSLRMGDLLIYYRSKYIHAIERKLQQGLDKLNKWATENGFRFSQTKTKCVHFCHKRELHNDPCLKLERTEIPLVNEHKFLGLVFNKKTYFYSPSEVLKV